MKKIWFAFLLIVVVFLTACDPTTNNTDDGQNDDNGDVIDDGNQGDDDEIVDDGDDEVPLEGIAEDLIIDLEGSLEGVFTGENLVYYFYLPEDLMVTIDVSADFDSALMVKNLTTNELVFDGDDSVYDDDVYTVLSLEAGEYMVELSSPYEEVGDFSLYVNLGIYIEELNMDQSVSASVTGTGVHTYYIEIEERGVYHILSESDGDLEGVLMDTSGAFITYNDDRRLDDEDFELMLELEVGTYLLALRTFSDDEIATYSLLMEDYSVTNSTVLSLGYYEVDYLLAGETNSYEISVPRPGWVHLYVNSVFDSVGYLYDISGNLILENDDDNGEGDFYIEIFLEPGEYRLDVGSFADYEGGYYEVYYEFFEEGVYDYDTIDVGGYVIDSLSGSEVDIFTFTLTEETYLDLYTVSTSDMYMEVYNASGTLLDFDDDSGDAYDASISDFLLSPGTYYIHISEVFSSPVSYYELHVYVSEEGGVGENSYDLILNTSVADVLVGGESNVYTFTIDVDGVFTAYLMSDFDSVGYLLNELGETITVNDDAAYNNLNFKIDAYPLSPGTYHLYVEGYDTSEAGAYTLVNVFEETSEASYEISPNDSFSGNLANEETDTVRFTLERGGYVRAYLDSGFDSLGSLVDFGGTVLLTGDDFGSETDFVLEGLYLDPGVYEINVSGYTVGEYGSYTLYLEMVYGGDINISNLGLNTSVSDILEADGYDWYRIEIEEAGYVDVYAITTFDSYGYILDEWGRFIAQNDDGYGNADFSISWYLEVGTYFVVVCGYSPLDSGDYTLYIDFTLPVD